MHPGIRTPDYIRDLAREMRNNLTPAERIVWERVRLKRLNGYRFRSQHPIYRYILDFYCHEKKLAVEVDGDIHDTRREYDEYRDEFLKSIGIETLRLNNDEVLGNTNIAIKKIERAIELL